MIKNKQSNYLITLAKFFIPFIVASIGMLMLYLIVEKASIGKLFLLMFAYFFPPLGKESIIPIGVSGGGLNIPILNQHVVIPEIDPLIMALTIAFVDICIALFLVWNYDLAKKIPLIGKFMAKIEKIGKSSSDRYGWIKPLRFIGIILFVMVPFQGSGGVVGSILGRLIGMKPWHIFFAISSGAIVGCLLIAYFADAILSAFVTNFLQVLLISIVILIVGIMVYFHKKDKKQ
jgi:uncharacterized membrane protein